MILSLSTEMFGLLLCVPRYVTVPVMFSSVHATQTVGTQ